MMKKKEVEVLFYVLQKIRLIGDEVDLSKEPFSKLKRDMAEELGLVK